MRPRAKSAAALLLEKLPGNPVVSVKSAARLTGRSYEAARLAVARLVKDGVLSQSSRNRKSGLYIAKDIFDAFTSCERSLLVLGGDTSVEKPWRSVPLRPARS